MVEQDCCALEEHKCSPDSLQDKLIFEKSIDTGSADGIPAQDHASARSARNRFFSPRKGFSSKFHETVAAAYEPRNMAGRMSTGCRSMCSDCVRSSTVLCSRYKP